MSSKNTKGLGKGLSALIGESGSVASESEAASAAESYQELSINQISVNPSQPRTFFDDEKLHELARSIAAVGLVQPVIVRKKGGGYELVAGERRWRAARIAGLETVPAIVRSAGDAESLELALIENINREDLNPMDTARAYANLQEEFGTTQEDLATRLGRSRSAIANTIRLLDLPDEVQKLIEHGQLSEGHGRALLSVPDRLKQKKLAARAAARGLSVRQTEDLARKETAGGDNRRPQAPPVRQEVMDEATDALYSAFRLPVKVRWAGKAGRIEIEFSGEEQLRKIIDTLEESY
ncbi:MAG: ParB/RepB/Spo0J family partition protein [Thermoleophilia bacterium]|nr:ParB/RepB/Spo0J family partition protein [Thermoleophilia bacterium]